MATWFSYTYHAIIPALPGLMVKILQILIGIIQVLLGLVVKILPIHIFCWGVIMGIKWVTCLSLVSLVNGEKLLMCVPLEPFHS